MEGEIRARSMGRVREECWRVELSLGLQNFFRCVWFV
jgi:hypothetical protein